MSLSGCYGKNTEFFNNKCEIKRILLSFLNAVLNKTCEEPIEEIEIKDNKELTKELLQYCHEYYDLDSPTISDTEYDKKFDTLKQLEDEIIEISKEKTSADMRLSKVRW